VSELIRAPHPCGTSPAPDCRPEKVAPEQEIKRSRQAVLVVNTRSRHGTRAYSEAKRLLVEGGITLDAAYPVRNAERLQAIVREEIANLVGAIDVLVNGKVANIDLAKINEDYFANGSSIRIPAVTVIGQQTSFQAFDVLIASGGYQAVPWLPAKRSPTTARLSSAS